MGLDTVELVYSVEEHFGIRIPDHVAATLVTVGSLHAFVVSEMERQGRLCKPEVAFEDIRKLVCDVAGVDPGRVVAEARFVDDLHMD